MNKSAVFLWFTAGIFGFCSILSGAEEEIWLSYHTDPDTQRLLGYEDIGNQGLKILTDAPAEVKLPEFKSQSPLFAKWKSPMAKGGFLWVALDQEQSSGPYNRLIIDANGDGHLNDETFITPYRSDQYQSGFGPAPVYFEGEDGLITYHLNFRFYNYQNYKNLSASSGCWYEGTIRLGEEKLKCMLMDFNADGEFNDISPNSGECDRIRAGKNERVPSQFTGKYLDIDGVLYCPMIARDGAFLTLSKAENVVYGKVQTLGGVTVLQAGGVNGLLTVQLENGAGKLPLGKYHIHTWRIERKDDQNRPWTLQGEGFDKNGNFEITKEEPAILAIGEPIAGHLDAQLNKNKYNFNYEMRGQLNERIEITRKGSRVDAPKIQIVNADKTYNQTFSLEYG